MINLIFEVHRNMQPSFKKLYCWYLLKLTIKSYEDIFSIFNVRCYPVWLNFILCYSIDGRQYTSLRKCFFLRSNQVWSNYSFDVYWIKHPILINCTFAVYLICYRNNQSDRILFFNICLKKQSNLIKLIQPIMIDYVIDVYRKNNSGLIQTFFLEAIKSHEIVVLMFI